MSSLGQRIRDFRLKKGITQIDLSQGLCTPSMISQIESDRARPSYKILFSIADRLEVPLEKLLNDVELGLELMSKYKMVTAMVKAREYLPAIPLLEDLLQLSHVSVSKVEIDFMLGICHMETGNDEQAMQFFNQVLEWAVFQRNHSLLASTLLNLGMVAKNKRELPIALYHTQRAWEELGRVETSDPMQKVRILSQLAAISQEMGKVDEAVRLYEELLSLFESCSSLQEKGQVYLNLAQAYHMQGDYAKSDEYATQAINVLNEMEDMDRHRDWQRQLILLKKSKEAWQQSVNELLDLAALYEHQADYGRAGEIYADIASICLENGEMDNAWGHAEKSFLILPHNHTAIGKVHRVLAFVHFGRGDQEKGQKHLNNAISIFQQQGQLSKLEEVTLHMCHFLSEQGRHKEAFDRLVRFHDNMVRTLNERGIML